MNLSQPNPGPRPPGSPCTGSIGYNDTANKILILKYPFQQCPGGMNYVHSSLDCEEGDDRHNSNAIRSGRYREFRLGAIHKGRPHREGGEGGSPKADIVREVAWIYSYRSSQNADKGGEGVQNPENFADVLYVWSLTVHSVHFFLSFTCGELRSTQVYFS